MDILQVLVIISVSWNISQGCGPSQADIIFLTDESGTVGESNFNKIKEALRDTIANLDIESGNVRVGIMCFESQQRTIFDLNEYNYISDMQIAVTGINYEGGGTKLGSAMSYTRSSMFDSTKGDREDVQNVMVILSGSTSSDDENTEASAARTANIRVISVGIGSSIDSSLLTSIAYDSSHYLQTDYNSLATTLGAFIDEKVTCPEHCDVGGGYERGGDISRISSLYSTTGATYVLMDTGSYLGCCGRIESWTFYPRRSGMIYFQVWHPTSGNEYKITGVNSVYIPAGMVHKRLKYTVPDNERITTNDGDRIGWYCPGQDMIPYGSLSCDAQYSYRFYFGNNSRGATHSFSSPENVNGTIFAVKLNLENETNDIWFANSGRNIHFLDTIPNNTYVHRIIPGQRDQEDLTLSWTDASGKFSFDTTTGIVSTIDTLTSGETYTIYFFAQDTCLNNSIANGTLLVTVSNTAPYITSLPGSATITESNKENTTLYLITVEDETDTNVSCAVDTTDPSTATNLFYLTQNTSMSYNLHVIDNPGFDYDTRNNYSLQISCTDGKNLPVSGRFDLYLTRNIRPILDDIPATSLAYHILNETANITVYTLSATDPDSSTFTYTQEYCGLTVCPMWIQNSSSGVVQFNKTLSDIGLGGFSVGFSVTDEKTKSQLKYHAIRLYGYNNPPHHVSLPAINNTIIIKENNPTDYYIFSVTAYDIDLDTLSFTFNITDGDWTYFTIKNGNDLYTSNIPIDYEKLSHSSYHIQATVTDGYNSSTEEFWIDIQDVNEAPTFNTTTYTVTVDEGEAGGEATPNPPAYVYFDVDAGDSHKFSLDCGDRTRYFTFNTTTGGISLARLIDVDTGAPTNMSCTVTLYDSGYLTDTANLFVIINDVNDNAPEFSQDYYTFFVSPEAANGTVVGTIAVIDADLSSPFNLISRIWLENQPLDLTEQGIFTYNNVTSQLQIQGYIFLEHSNSTHNLTQFSYASGDHIEFSIRANDSGSPSLDANATITILIV